MPQGLSVSRLIDVTVVLTPLAAQGANLNSLLIVGDSPVINVSERIRSYNSIEDVGADFSANDPEYLAAELFFEQVPQPPQLYIGRWAAVATEGLLLGGALTAQEQTIATWNAINQGEFKIAINGGAATNVGPIDFTNAANLNAVAAEITTALGTAAITATCVWNANYNRFEFNTNAGAAGNSVAFLTAGVGGTDIHAMLKGDAADGATQVNGIAAETPVQAVTILDQNAISWYGLTFAATNAITNNEYLAVSPYIEAAANPHIFGISSADPECLDPASNTDIAYLTKNGNFSRTFVQYSAAPYVCASFFGRAITINFNGSNTTLTMMYKVEPGVAAESLTPSQADALQGKNADVFVNYNNGTAIIQYGTVANGDYFDDIFGLDWLKNAVQTAVYNLLYTSPTKIPQTDAGNQLIANTITSVLAQGVTNGLLAPGTWNSAGFGQLQQGQFLDKGYYVYTPPIATQLQVDREARKSVTFQVAAKLAGAIHTVDIQINVNR